MISLGHLQVEAVDRCTGLRRAQSVERTTREPEGRQRRGPRPRSRGDGEPLHEATATEHERDELVATIRVYARDDDDASAVGLGELRLAERCLARDPPAPDLCVATQLRHAQLAVADPVD